MDVATCYQQQQEQAPPQGNFPVSLNLTLRRFTMKNEFKCNKDLEKAKQRRISELDQIRESLNSLLPNTEVGRRDRKALQTLKSLMRMLEEQFKKTADLEAEVHRIRKKFDQSKLLHRKHLQLNVQFQRALGQQLHDSLAQHLYATRALVSTFLRKKDRGLEVQVDDLEQLSNYLKIAENEARNLARGIIPVELDGTAGLAAALQRLIDRICQLWENIDCELKVDQGMTIADDFEALKLYYIAREAVNNALKHAKASRIVVRLRTGEQNETILEVIDNGVGITKEDLEAGGGLGIEIMRHRAEIIGARLEITRRPEGGTVVRCILSPQQR